MRIRLARPAVRDPESRSFELEDLGAARGQDGAGDIETGGCADIRGGRADLLAYAQAGASRLIALIGCEALVRFRSRAMRKGSIATSI